MYLELDIDTDRPQKTLSIYTFVFTGTYTGPFCHNPVESWLILLDSGSNPVESSEIWWNGWIPAGICGASKSTDTMPDRVQAILIASKGQTRFWLNVYLPSLYTWLSCKILLDLWDSLHAI